MLNDVKQNVERLNSCCTVTWKKQIKELQIKLLKKALEQHFGIEMKLSREKV